MESAIHIGQDLMPCSSAWHNTIQHNTNSGMGCETALCAADPLQINTKCDYTGQ